MKKVTVLSLALVLLTAFTVYNENYFTDLVKEKLKEYITTDTPDKIYIHTDKPYYSLGEDIWFTAYLLNGVSHTANAKSFVLYVELINEKGSIAANKKLFTSSVTVPGDFKIDENWNEGTYTLRAYTNYMRNGNPNYFFKKTLNVFSIKDKTAQTNLNDIEEKTEPLKLIKPNLNFYPEGGNLIENIRSEVAIKIKDELYSDLKIKGTIVDNNDVLISQFTTSKFGLSKFSFTPIPNKAYRAKVDINGSEYSYPLPKALPNGHAINLTNKGEYIYIKVKSNLATALKQTYLVGHQRGKIVVEKFETTNTGEYLLKLLTSDLNDGVTHFTLFDSSGNPVCERLVFIENPKNKTSIEIKKDKEYIGPREQLKLNLNIKDSQGNNLNSHLSMSVRDLSAFPHNKNAPNIKTWLLLNSDLRGEIKDPGYFLNEENVNKRRYLIDLVMLTHGWRRFIWKDLLYKEKTPDAYPFEKGISITGKTQKLKPPYPIVPSVSRLTLLKQPMEQEPQQISEDGKFSFGPYLFFDSIPMLIESRLSYDFISKDIKNRQLSIILDQNTRSPEIEKNNEIIIDSSKNEAFLRITKYMNKIKSDFDKQRQILDEVIITARKKQEESERQKEINSRVEYGEPTHRLDLENGLPIRGVNTAYDLISRMPGVAAFGGTITLRGDNPRIIIDNLPVDTEFTKTVNSDDVSFIDLLTGPSASMYSDSGGGIIIIYTKIGNFSNVINKPGRINFTAKGFYTAREFYAPDHINGFDEQMKADIRTTLHWEPEIKIEKNGTAEISFFTSDSKGQYLIEVEGVSNSGLPLYQTSKFTVD